MNGDERFAFATMAMDAKLKALGLAEGRHEFRSPLRGDGSGIIGGMVSRFTGRDPSGHALECEIDIALREDEALIQQSIDTKLGTQERSAMRVGLHPPVQPGPNMRLGHLRIFAPFARRLRNDHGENAQQALRHALQTVTKGTSKRLSRDPRPYGIAIDANRIDHREELAAGVHLKGRHLVLHAMMLPDQILGGIIGRPVTMIVQHPLLDDGMTITRAYSERSSPRSGGGVTVLDMDGGWVPGDTI